MSSNLMAPTKRHLTIMLVFVLASLVSASCIAGTDVDMTYEEAMSQMTHLVELIDDIVQKTTQAVLRANHFHQMEQEAMQADEAVEGLLEREDELIREAEDLGIVLTSFLIRVFNEDVGRWVEFDPIHLTSSGG